MTSSQASMQAPQAMHSYCRPLRMSMPTGQTCTHMVQSMQSPSSSNANFGSGCASAPVRSEEHTSELQSLMRISYAVFCLKKKKKNNKQRKRKYYIHTDND